jgi:hypothetical protein
MRQGNRAPDILGKEELLNSQNVWVMGVQARL